LLQGDIHGVQTIPREIAARVPSAANNILQKRQSLVEICCSSGFTPEKLHDAVKRLES